MIRRKLNQNNSGQAVLEYILLLTIILGVVGVLSSKLRDSADLVAARSGAKLEKLLRTGSAKPTLWNK